MDQTKLEVLRRRGENNYMDDEVRTQIYIQQYKFVSEKFCLKTSLNVKYFVIKLKKLFMMVNNLEVINNKTL